MTALALALVVFSGLVHATWNLLAKRSGEDGVPFVWLYSALSVLIYAPVAAFFVLDEGASIGWEGALFMVGTGILHAAYFLCLQKGYGAGDLSMVYPLARGAGPLLASFAAVFLFGEHLGPVAVGGILAIVGGVFLLAREPGGADGTSKRARTGVLYGLLTGVLIAAYTLWDKYAVSDLALAPVLYYWASLFVESALLTPLLLRSSREVREAWREHHGEAIGVAVLSPLAYLLVLTAMVFSPVSRIAPVREVGILFGTLMGGRLLAEGGVGRRLLAAGLLVAGIAALAFG